MENNRVITGILMDENTDAISFTQACETYHIPEEFLIALLEHGLFDTMNRPIKQANLSLHMIKRIRSARRLQDDLGVNLEGVVLAMELLEEIDRMREELSILRHHVR